MNNLVHIPNGAILNCYLPKRKGSLKRSIMNIEAKIIQRHHGFSELLNHTAMIEKTESGTVLVWESSVGRGVGPVELSLYDQDAVFIITHGDSITGAEALHRLKEQSGKDYDVKSWGVYLRFLVSGKWAGGTSYAEYSHKWFCSELVDNSWRLSETPYQSTPNHVYHYTAHNTKWIGTYTDLVYQLKKQTLIIQ